MHNNNKNKGITLIEILVSLTLLLIFASLMYGIFTGITKNFFQLSDQNQLEQEANEIFSIVKGYHLRYNSYTIKYSSSDKRFVIEATDETNVSKASALGNNNLFTIRINGTLIPKDGSKTSIDTKNTLNITIQFDSEQGEKFEASIKRY